MSSLASIPGEARCKQVVHYLLTNKTTCTTCSSKLSWKREYGWCKLCRTKVRPKAATWMRSSNLKYRQIFGLLWCFQNRQSPHTARLVADVSYPTVRRWYTKFRENLPESSFITGVESLLARRFVTNSRHIAPTTMMSSVFSRFNSLERVSS